MRFLVLVALVVVPLAADTDSLGRPVGLSQQRDGVTQWELRLDATGVPEQEVFFEDGAVADTATLEYEGGRLVERRTYDAQGGLLFTDRLSWWPDGTLRRLDRRGPQGARVSWSYQAGRLVSTWTEGLDGPGAHRQWVRTGDQVRESLVRDGNLVVERLRGADALGSVETSREPGAKRTVVRRLDPQGRVVEQIETVDGREVSRSHWEYVGDRTASVTTTSAAGQELWTYDHDGVVTRGRLTRDGVLVQEESLDDGNLVESRYYDRGALVLVETWSQGKKTKETYYRNGAVVRERRP